MKTRLFTLTACLLALLLSGQAFATSVMPAVPQTADAASRISNTDTAQTSNTDTAQTSNTDTAQTSNADTVQIEISTSEKDSISADELLMGYLRQESGFVPEAVLQSTARDSLNDFNAALYDILKEMIQDIAAGNRQSTKITITPEDLPGFDLSGSSANDILASLDFSLSSLNSALKMDFPYDLYWSDGTISFSYYSYSMGSVTRITSMALSFGVSDYYSAGKNTVRSDLSGILNAVQANVSAIVTENQNKSDYDKLSAYKEAICELVSYNNEAAAHLGDPSYNDKDPWQLIYVFDGDDTTNVVCEGYSKAFKHLCDLSEFTTPDFVCYLVIGDLSTSAGQGEPHMWNIVTLDGKNYLVDVTNCDGNSVGSPDYLFMKPPMEGYNTQSAGYRFAVNKPGYMPATVYYTGLDENAKAYGASMPFLTLTLDEYSAPAPTPTETPISSREIVFIAANSASNRMSDGNSSYRTFNAVVDNRITDVGVKVERTPYTLGTGSSPYEHNGNGNVICLTPNGLVMDWNNKNDRAENCVILNTTTTDDGLIDSGYFNSTSMRVERARGYDYYGGDYIKVNTRPVADADKTLPTDLNYANCEWYVSPNAYIYFVNIDGNIERIDLKDLGTDNNDWVYYVVDVDDNELTSVFIAEVDDDETPTTKPSPTPTETPIPSAFAVEVSEPLDSNGNPLTISALSGDIMVPVAVHADAPIQVTCIVPLFDTNDRFAGTGTAVCLLKPDDTSISVPVSLFGNAAYGRVFVVDENLVPVSNTLPFTLA